MARPDRIRHQFYLSRNLTERFEAIANEPGVCKSSILEAALTEFLKRKGDKELEISFAHRLDYLSRQLEQLTTTTAVVRESLFPFIRYVLAAVPPPQGDEAQKLGYNRFRLFLERVSQVLALAGIHFDPDKLK